MGRVETENDNASAEKVAKPENKGAPAPVANPARLKTADGFKVAVVLPGAPDLILTFDTELLRDKGATLIQNSVKRGAVSNGFPVRAREGVFWFCHVAYIKRVD